MLGVALLFLWPVTVIEDVDPDFVNPAINTRHQTLQTLQTLQTDTTQQPDMDTTTMMPRCTQHKCIIYL